MVRLRNLHSVKRVFRPSAMLGRTMDSGLGAWWVEIRVGGATVRIGRTLEEAISAASRALAILAERG